MPLSNKELARRADIAISDLEANGGVMLPEQADTFLDIVQDQPTLLRDSRFIRMNAPIRKIDRMGFADRIMKAAPQGTSPFAADDGSNDRYLAAADRSKVTTSQIELVTKEMMAEVHIPYDVLEDNIEGERFEDHVIRQMAERAALDLEDWFIHADTGDADPYLALTDGILKRAVNNVFDNTGSGVTPDTFENAMLTMPQQYLANRQNLRHYITVQDEIRYRGNVAKRATGYGDSSLTANNQINAFGVPVTPTPRMDPNQAIFTDPKNLLFGVQRQIGIETDRDIRARMIIIVMTIRADVQIDDLDAIVKVIDTNAVTP